MAFASISCCPFEPKIKVRVSRFVEGSSRVELTGSGTVGGITQFGVQEIFLTTWQFLSLGIRFCVFIGKFSYVLITDV